MGCDVVALNAQADGHFPGRDPEPTEENLRLLMSTVPAAKADLGIAHDGDGDRMVAVDHEGRFVGGDALLVLFAKREVRRGLVVPVDASMVLEDLLPKATIWRTRVGAVYVAAELKRRGADFGGEPSGTWIFPKASYCPDGMYAAARLVSLVAENPLASLVRGIPRYPVIRGAIGYDASKRRAIEARLDSAMRSLASDVTTVDGWRLQFDDGWALVRFSGTEPKIRVLAESRDDARARRYILRSYRAQKAPPHEGSRPRGRRGNSDASPHGQSSQAASAGGGQAVLAPHARGAAGRRDLGGGDPDRMAGPPDPGELRRRRGAGPLDRIRGAVGAARHGARAGLHAGPRRRSLPKRERGRRRVGRRARGDDRPPSRRPRARDGARGGPGSSSLRRRRDGRRQGRGPGGETASAEVDPDQRGHLHLRQGHLPADRQDGEVPAGRIRDHGHDPRADGGSGRLRIPDSRRLDRRREAVGPSPGECGPPRAAQRHEPRRRRPGRDAGGGGLGRGGCARTQRRLHRGPGDRRRGVRDRAELLRPSGDVDRAEREGRQRLRSQEFDPDGIRPRAPPELRRGQHPRRALQPRRGHEGGEPPPR